MSNYSEAFLLDESQQNTIARVGLNGYKSITQNPTQLDQGSNLIWSFTILDGDRRQVRKLWSHSRQATLQVNEHSASVRVVAYPVERGGYGLIEFI